MWVMRTAESVVLTLWPPGPRERYTSIWRSFGSMSTSTSSASASTVTVADDVWMRPWLSVTGTRCTRCGPALVLEVAPHVVAPDRDRDLVEAAQSAGRGQTSTFQPCGAA